MTIFYCNLYVEGMYTSPAKKIEADNALEALQLFAPNADLSKAIYSDVKAELILEQEGNRHEFLVMAG